MIIVYVTNSDLGKVADLSLRGQVSYRNPSYWRGEVERCKEVYIIGNHPKIEKAYGDKVIKRQKSSSDYTISELRELRSEISDWESFIKHDKRKTVSKL